MRDLLIRLGASLDDLAHRIETEGHPIVRHLLHGIESAVETVRQLKQSLPIAAALSFTTILSIVPLLAVTFALLNAFVTNESVAQTVQDWLLSTLLADSVADVTVVLTDFLDRANGGALGAVGTVFLLGTTISLFLSVEASFNGIWRVPLSRPLHRRLTTFYAVITLTPALIGVGVYMANSVADTLREYSFGLTLGAGVLSWIMMVGGLTLMYKLLPHTTVRWRVAIAGALGASIALLISRAGFNYYIVSIYQGSVQSKIYGTLSLVPVFFMWVYLTWIIVLGGNILAYTVQHRETLTRAVLRRRRRLDEPAPPNGYLVTRVFLLIARHFRRNGGGLAPERIAEQLQIEANEVNPALQVLRDGELVLEVVGNRHTELVPARPLDQVQLIELYALAERAGYKPGQLPGGRLDGLESYLDAAEQARHAQLEVTVDQVLDDAGPGVDEEAGVIDPEARDAMGAAAEASAEAS